MTDKDLEKTELLSEEKSLSEVVEESHSQTNIEGSDEKEAGSEVQEIASEKPSEFLSHWQKKHQEYLEKKAEYALKKKETTEEKTPPHPALRHLQMDQLKVEEDNKEVVKSSRQIPSVVLWKSLPVFLVIILFISLSIYFISPLSKQKQFTFKGNEHLSSQVILEDSLISEKDYAVTTLLNRKGHARNIKNSSAWIKSASIQYHFPNRFTIDIVEYKEIGYVPIDGAYYSVLSSGKMSETATDESNLPESHTTINLKDQELVKKLVLQLAEVDQSIVKNIQTIDLTPTKATADLVTLVMYDGNQILVPISQVEKKLPYYEKIAPQLLTPSVIDMEVGVFSYAL